MLEQPGPELYLSNPRDLLCIAQEINPLTLLDLCSLILFFQYVDRELLRNFLLAGVSVFVVVLLLVVDLRSSLLVLMCVAFTTVGLFCTFYFFIYQYILHFMSEAYTEYMRLLKY